MVGLTNHQQPVLQGLRGRGRNRSSVARIKRQQQQQQAGRRALQDQPFRRCGDDGKWKGKLGFCQGNVLMRLFDSVAVTPYPLK